MFSEVCYVSAAMENKLQGPCLCCPLPFRLGLSKHAKSTVPRHAHMKKEVVGREHLENKRSTLGLLVTTILIVLVLICPKLHRLCCWRPQAH
jgi:hypothetical protein